MSYISVALARALALALATRVGHVSDTGLSVSALKLFLFSLCCNNGERMGKDSTTRQGSRCLQAR